MLSFVQGKASARQLRLFACACSRRVLPYLPGVLGQKVLATAEAYAEGRVTWEECSMLLVSFNFEPWADSSDFRRTEAQNAVKATAWYDVSLAAGHAAFHAARVSKVSEKRVQANLLRDIVGPNPCRPPVFNPCWLRWNDNAVVKVARRIYDKRSFEGLPILADALEEAGCTNRDILAHCRREGPHVRGCWVVDRCLGLS